MKPQQECITLMSFLGIFICSRMGIQANQIEKLFKEKGIRKHRLWRRNIKVTRHYIETGVLGGYETTGIKDKTLDGKPIPLFEDTEIKENADTFCLERHMDIAGKKFLVSSVFPKSAASTPTDKLLTLIDKEQEN